MYYPKKESEKSREYKYDKYRNRDSEKYRYKDDGKYKDDKIINNYKIKDNEHRDSKW